MGAGLPRWSLLSREAKVFVVLVLLEAAAVLALTVQDLVANAPLTRSNRFHFEFGFLFLICTVVAAYFGVSGTVRENALELGIFCWALAMAMVYVVYTMMYPGDAQTGGKVDPHSPAAIIRLVLVTVATLASIPGAMAVHRAFGWRAYKTVGADPELSSAFAGYSVLIGCLKLDALVSFVTLYIAGMTLLHEEGLIADSIALLVTWAALAAAAGGARYEQNGLTGLFLMLAPLEPAYIVWKLAQYYQHKHEYDSRVRYVHALIGTGIVATLIRLVSVILALKSWCMAGRGLPAALDAADARNADESEGFAIRVSASGSITTNDWGNTLP